MRSRNAKRACVKSELEDGWDVVLEAVGLLVGLFGSFEVGSGRPSREFPGTATVSEGLVSFWFWWRRSSFSRKFGLGWLGLRLGSWLGLRLGSWLGLGNGCCLNRAFSRLVRGRRVREGVGFLEVIGVLLGRLYGL
jgi:hypothetical protein